MAGALRWLHVSCDDRFTHYRLGARSAIWTEYVGIAVHDRLASYWTRLSDETAHGVCNAHLLRNLEEIVELEKAPDGWAAAMQTLLLEAWDTAVHWCDTTGSPVPEPVRRQTAAAWDALLAPVLDPYEGLPPPACGHHRGHNLALWTLRDACLLFLADLAVPFTNNRAEQVLRRAKLPMKIAGGFRTPAGPSASPACGACSRRSASRGTTFSTSFSTSCGWTRRRRCRGRTPSCPNPTSPAGANSPPDLRSPGRGT